MTGSGRPARAGRPARRPAGPSGAGRAAATRGSILYFRDRAAWRAWLRAHHARRIEAWVAHVKKGSRREGLAYEDGVEEALCFGWIDGLMHALDADFFAQRYTPRTPHSLWSASNVARVERLVRQRKMTRAGLVHVEAAQADGRWQAAGRRQDPDWIPDDLRAALSNRPGALEAFQALPPSTRRMHGFLVESARRKETRTRRIEAAIESALQRPGAGSSPAGRTHHPRKVTKEKR